MMVRDGAAGAGSGGRMPTSMTTADASADEPEPGVGDAGGAGHAEAVRQ
ncbi:hypothetical protein F4692_003520 [Nocardioides cavernae]|uniref:Uncharacterized protein n=1 Tax=Nocardioides cavernae TaxID=1921566 RepID=A0A7Y9H5M9_9ACTN|nr:hypothetical protein [Nocardioides cavernae]NYE38372.1 hypothetical protein [Nocardioides cavernae]